MRSQPRALLPAIAIPVALATGIAPVDAGPVPTRATLCAKGSADLLAAQGLYRRLEEQVGKSRGGDDAASPVDTLRALLTSPCYALAQREGSGFLPPTSPLSLHAWWDAGGDVWLRSYLSPVFSITYDGANPRPEALHKLPARTLADLVKPAPIEAGTTTDCTPCQTDQDCQAPLVCAAFADGTRRCGGGDATACRTR